MKNYIKNLETGKIELHFEKEEYQALSLDQRKELKRFFLWSKTTDAWVSKSKNNYYSAINTAKKLGFEGEQVTGERLSYTEELERKAERAEQRAERYEQYAENANNKGKQLQSGFNECRKDWSWVTQPNINSSAGRAFTNQRNKIINRYEKGFEEYRKSEYFQERAETARQTADMGKLKDKTYLHNRTQECNKQIKYYQSVITQIEDQNFNNSQQGLPERDLTEYLNKMEWEIDKLAFLENCLDEIGGVIYNKDNVKPGYFVKIRGRWDLVLKANKTTILVKSGVSNLELKYPYAEIQEVKIPENWTEQKEELENPFQIGDIVVRQAIGGNRIIAAFQIIKTSNKTVTIQRIKVEENKPILDNFVNDKTERKAVKKDRSGNIVLNDGSWYLYRYTQEEKAV